MNSTADRRLVGGGFHPNHRVRAPGVPECGVFCHATRRRGLTSKEWARRIPLRYVLLEARLPELSFVASACRREVTPILGCRISVYEVTGGALTFVTTSNPLARYPLLGLARAAALRANPQCPWARGLARCASQRPNSMRSRVLKG